VICADDAWIPLAETAGWIALHCALTEEQIAAVLGWLEASAPAGFRLGSPIPPAWQPGPMTTAAGKYLDLEWNAGTATVRIRHPRPGSELAELRAALGAAGYDAPLPEGPAAVARALGVRTPNLNVAPLLDVDALLALDGRSIVVELPVPLIEQAIVAVAGMAPAPPPARVPSPSKVPLAVETLLAQPDQPSEPIPPEPEPRPARSGDDDPPPPSDAVVPLKKITDPDIRRYIEDTMSASKDGKTSANQLRGKAKKWYADNHFAFSRHEDWHKWLNLPEYSERRRGQGQQEER
jgi:hypothetical protein